MALVQVMDKDLEIKRHLVLLLDELLEKDYWQDSLFLQAAEKQILEMRSRIASDRQLQAVLHEPQQNTLNVSTNDLTSIYIALYQADGNNLAKWAQVLATITNLSISRPIYKHEYEIQACMRAIEKKQNHAYAEILVHTEDIIATSTPPTDKNGFELLMIKERSIKPENIQSLTHSSGLYLWKNGQLIRKDNIDFSE
jgi:Dot/Icm secretion system protein IcmQ